MQQQPNQIQYLNSVYQFSLNQKQEQIIDQQPQLQEEEKKGDEMEEQNDLNYVLNMVLSENKERIYAAMADRSIKVFQITNDGIQEVGTIEDAHDKKINQLIINENALYSCSNDGFIHLWDINNFKKIQSLSQQGHEITSISNSKHILAGGSDKECVLFWDLQKMKFRGKFDETLTNDVTSVKFSKNNPTALLGASLDGMVSLFDLTKTDEEESAEFVIRVNQPVEQCDFFRDSIKYAYAMSTSNTIDILDMENSKQVLHINTINFNEYNNDYLIDLYEPNNQELRYLMGNDQGIVSEYVVEENKQLKRQIQTKHTSSITCCQYLNQDILLTCGYEGQIEISKLTDQPFQQKSQLDMEEQQNYFTSDKNEENLNEDNNMIGGGRKQQQKKVQNKPNFNPF